ncbi:MAG: hypothetical protein PHX21_13910 [bacterium]|nr:hypothetical protein [bacterium]
MDTVGSIIGVVIFLAGLFWAVNAELGLWQFIGVIVLGLVILTLLSICHITTQGPLITEKATVRETRFKPEETNTGLGTGISGNGQVTVMPIITSSGEKHNIVFQTNSGLCLYEDNKEWYEKFQKGDTVSIGYRKNILKFLFSTQFEYVVEIVDLY